RLRSGPGHVVYGTDRTGSRPDRRAACRASERAGAGESREAAPESAVRSDGQLVRRYEFRPRRVALRPALSEAHPESAERVRHRDEAAQGREDLQGRYRAVLARRSAAHHDAVLANGDDS